MKKKWEKLHFSTLAQTLGTKKRHSILKIEIGNSATATFSPSSSQTL